MNASELQRGAKLMLWNADEISSESGSKRHCIQRDLCLFPLLWLAHAFFVSPKNAFFLLSLIRSKKLWIFSMLPLVSGWSGRVWERIQRCRRLFPLWLNCRKSCIIFPPPPFYTFPFSKKCVSLMCRGLRVSDGKLEADAGFIFETDRILMMIFADI